MSKKTLMWWLLTLVMAVTLFAVLPMGQSDAGGAVALYVYAGGGDDGNDGSLANPYATIHKAISEAQTTYSGDEVIVYLKEGDYIATEYITHANLTIEAFSDGAENYDEVTIYPDYDSTLTAPNQIYTSEWIFAVDNLASKVGFTLRHVNLSGDDFATGEVEDGSAVTGMYSYSADGAGSYITLDGCNVSNMQWGVLDRYSDYLTLFILNCDIHVKYPVKMDNSPYLIIHNSTLKMSAPDSSGSVIDLNGTPTVDIQENTIMGNSGSERGIYEDARNGIISNNTFLDLYIALELSEIGNLTVSGNYVETTKHGFDLETFYENPASITVNDNIIINKTLNLDGQTGIKLYLNDDTSGSTFDVYGNEIINFAYGFYYDGDDYYTDLINLNLANEGFGNKFRGNILNMYIESLRSTSKVDMSYTDWGTTDRQEIYDHMYFRDIYPSSGAATAAATHEEAFVFDETFTTSALENVYVDDDFNSSTSGFGETHFNSITEAKSRVRSGGTVNVAEGLYDEQVFIFHPVIIQGSGENTVIKNTAGSDKPIMLIAAPDTTIKGMNFQEGFFGLLIGDFAYCLTYLNNPLTFYYHDNMADNVIIYDNYFGNQDNVSIYLSYQKSPGVLEGLTIEGNTFNSDTDYTNSVLSSRHDFIINSPVIKDNQVVYGYKNGFHLRFAGDALIQGNDIVIDGSFLYPYEGKGGFVLDAEGNGLITDNTIQIAEGVNYADADDDSIGIGYDVDVIPADPITADFYNNSFSGLDYALYFYAYGVDLEEGTIDVTVGGSNENYNDLSNNTYGVVSQYKPVGIDASYNVWGVADENIPDMILDINDASYYGTVNYLPSATLIPEDPELSDLQVSPVTLVPAFDPEVYEYTASAANEVTAVTITPSADAGTIYVNDTGAASGSSVEIPLVVGENTITIEVENGELSATYTITVTRAAAVNTGGGGGSYTPPAITVTTEKTDDTTKTLTEISATTSSGEAEASISTTVVNALLDKAKTENGISKGDVIEVSVDTPADTRKLEVNIPKAGLERIASNSDAGFGIASPLISVTFDGKAIETISGAAEGGNITVSAGIVDNSALSEKDRARVAGRPVYDLGVKNGDVQVSHFGGGHATVRIPYTLKQGENPNAVVIYYLGDDGSLKTVRGHFDAAVGAVVFKTTHFSNFVIGHNPVSFDDVKADAWYKDAVDFISARGITSGTGDNNYSPEKQLTRGQFIVLLMNAYQIDSAGGSDDNTGSTDNTGNFADAGNTYYTNYLAAAKSLGIAKGVGNNMFAPDKEITRQEMFVLLYNALKLIDELPSATTDKQLNTFRDASLVASWATDAMSALVQSGIVNGSGNMLNPAETTTRAQMAQVLYNLLVK